MVRVLSVFLRMAGALLFCLSSNVVLAASSTTKPTTNANTINNESTDSDSSGLLQIIGAGFGRTGTHSLKLALDQLGYKTYHMTEVFYKAWRGDIDWWIDYFQGDIDVATLVREVFEKHGYTAAVDHPARDAWQALAVQYPNAKIILTERSTPQKYWESASQTTLIHPWYIHFLMDHIPIFFHKFKRLNELVFQHSFLGLSSDTIHRMVTLDDRALVMNKYEENSAIVRALARQYPDRFLLYHVKDGWEPLCRFLDLPVPTTSFPVTNSRFVFQIRFFLLFAGVVGAGFAVLVGSILVWYRRPRPQRRLRSSNSNDKKVKRN